MARKRKAAEVISGEGNANVETVESNEVRTCSMPANAGIRGQARFSIANQPAKKVRGQGAEKRYAKPLQPLRL